MSLTRRSAQQYVGGTHETRHRGFSLRNRGTDGSRKKSSEVSPKQPSPKIAFVDVRDLRIEFRCQLEFGSEAHSPGGFPEVKTHASTPREQIDDRDSVSLRGEGWMGAPQPL